MKRHDITPKMVRQLLFCDFDTGQLYWRERDRSIFNTTAKSPEFAAKRWNSKWSGKKAFTAINHNGYFRGSLLGVGFLAHRLVWAIHYDKWPMGELDHINGDPRDNRIQNLRDVSHAVNMRNSRLRADNTSGIPGVRFDSQRKKWVARSYVDGSCRLHARYESKKCAIEARAGVAGFHDNHGRERPVVCAEPEKAADNG